MSKDILDSEFQDPNRIIEIDAQTKANINKIIIYVNASIKDVLLVRNLLILMSIFSICGLLLTIELFESQVFYSGKIESLIIAGLYLACALSIKTYPKETCLVALLIFLTIQFYFHYIEFRELWSWIIIKVPILYILIQGIRGIYKIEKDSIVLLKNGLSHDEVYKIKHLDTIPILK